jgi:hypothetical protein
MDSFAYPKKHIRLTVDTLGELIAEIDNFHFLPKAAISTTLAADRSAQHKLDMVEEPSDPYCNRHLPFRFPWREYCETRQVGTSRELHGPRGLDA